MFAREHDTIFAPASGVGRAAIAVLRISGPGCAAALARSRRGRSFLTAARSSDPAAPWLRGAARPGADHPLRGAAQFHRRGDGGSQRHRRTRRHRRGCQGAGAHSRPATCRAGRIRLARVRQRQDRSFGGRRDRRSGRSGNGGAAAPGATNRRRRAEPRVRGDSRCVSSRRWRPSRRRLIFPTSRMRTV